MLRALYWIFYENMSLIMKEPFFVAGAILSEVKLSLFVASAVFGEFWHDSRNVKSSRFPYEMCVLSAKNSEFRDKLRSDNVKLGVVRTRSV